MRSRGSQELPERAVEFEALPFGAMLVDGDGNVAAANARATEIVLPGDPVTRPK